MLRNDEIVITEGNLRANDDQDREIIANKITYNKIPNIVETEGKVKVEDKINEYTIFTDKAIYKRNDEIVLTEGNSRAIDDQDREIIYN